MRQQSQKSPANDQRAAVTRASVTFPTVLYQALEEIAQRKKVSLAWVVRDAAEQYVAAEQPVSNRPSSTKK